MNAGSHSPLARCGRALVIAFLAMSMSACGGGGAASDSASEIARTGKILVPVGSERDYGQSVYVQSDGKILVGGYSGRVSNWDFSLIRLNANGSLDPGFGAGGKVIMDGGSNTDDHIYGIAVQPDGRIVAAGSGLRIDGATGSGSPTGHNIFALMRFNPDGSLDSSFGGGGMVVTDFGRARDGVSPGVALQPDGKILAAGYNQSDFAVTRYNPDGSLDNSFGGGGMVFTDFSIAGMGRALSDGNSIALQSDGKIVVSGTSNRDGSNNFAVARYNPDGSLDNGFGSEGKVVTGFGTGNEDSGRGVIVQPDGKIVVAGTSSSGTSSDFALARYNPDGSPDAGFGDGGKLVTHVGSGPYDGGYGIAMQSDGKILMAGYSDSGKSGNYWNFAVLRYNRGGSLDSSFGSNGARVVDIGGNGNDVAQSITVQQDGRIVAAGYSRIAGGDFDFSLIRLTADGNLDTTFGEVATNISK